ncbi:MAG: sn-glycerol-3-phosphate ABC transporter ATP-binding protein UgpC [Pseudoclavibacter sp.]|nr:sn-glycerol-3-phosphate ABC transporter ATP-binding protein UgpC [Pseudoclavibacter sp.]
MATVAFDRVTLQYPGAARPSVRDLSLELADGEFLVLVGPSGCGKSTTLRMLAGLEQVTSGSILIDGVDVTETDPKDRDIAMVFQSYALYPHMTVAENMGFALKLAGRPREEIRERVARAAEILDLSRYLDRKPKALSGGERQRVAMGRAIVREPAVFCMDEPLSNLDAKLRVQTRGQIARLQQRLGTTTLYVTHDQVEALTMGHRVAVLDRGELQQIAAPRELYRRPANVFVAGFVGSPAMNLLELDAQHELLSAFGARLPASDGPRAVTLGVRPEHLRPDPAGRLELSVDMVEELGSDSYVYGRARLPGEPQIAVRVAAADPPRPDEVLRVGADPEQLHLFDTETGERLPES